METELIRLRVDPELARQAERICAGAGFELREVLRLCVARIAHDGTVPFDVGDAKAMEARRRPFHEYDERLWADLKPSIDAEVALALLARFIADCSTRIDEEELSGHADRQLADRLAQAREQARTLKSSLDVADPAAVRRVLDRFGPLVRSGTA